MYTINGKKVYAFSSQDCDSCSYRSNTGDRGDWDAIIIEENGDTKLVYFESFKSKQECQDACKAKFESLYKGEAWLGF